MNRAVWEERRRRNHEIAKAIEAGKDFSEIAQKFNLSVATIRFIAREFGLLTKPTPAIRQIGNIIADFNKGKDEKALAKKYGRNYYYMAALLKKNIPGYIPRKKRTTPLRNQKIIERYQAGSPIKKIASHFKLSEVSIRRILNESGVRQKKFTRRKRSSRA